MNRSIWYRSIAAADAAGLLTATQMRDFLEMKHPISAKKHRNPDVAIHKNDTPL